MENAFLTAASEAELSLSRMRAALDSLRTSLEQQDELTELISLCMAQASMGNMSNPIPATMKMMGLGLPVWPDPAKNIEELENVRDREFALAESLLREVQSHADLCEALQEKAAGKAQP